MHRVAYKCILLISVSNIKKLSSFYLIPFYLAETPLLDAVRVYPLCMTGKLSYNMSLQVFDGLNSNFSVKTPHNTSELATFAMFVAFREHAVALIHQHQITFPYARPAIGSLCVVDECLSSLPAVLGTKAVSECRRPRQCAFARLPPKGFKEEDRLFVSVLLSVVVIHLYPIWKWSEPASVNVDIPARAFVCGIRLIQLLSARRERN